MPHMMPMMWTLILILSLSILFITLMMIYFMHIVPMNFNSLNMTTKQIKWTWKW